MSNSFVSSINVSELCIFPQFFVGKTVILITTTSQLIRACQRTSEVFALVEQTRNIKK
jgi:hypothetical protein